MSRYPETVTVERAKLASEAECNLNAFAAIQAILEGGILRGPSADCAKGKIIKLCLEEQQRQLVAFDKALGRKATP